MNQGPLAGLALLTETIEAAKRMRKKLLPACIFWPGSNVLVFERGLSTPMEPHERTDIRGRKSARQLRAAPRRTTAEAASLLRAHDRLGHRRRGCGSGRAAQGARGIRRG